MPILNLTNLVNSSYRIALLLTGDARESKKIVSWLVERFPVKSDEETVERWFRHHTLLRSRETAYQSGVSRDGVYAPTGETRRDAFARAVAGLDQQQREAWLLTTIEGATGRLVGAAMDLSTTAAMNHLNAAKKQLSSLVGESSDLEAVLIQVHRAIEVPGGLTDRAMARRVKRKFFRRIKQVLILLLAIAFCFGCLYVLKLSGQLVPFFEFVSRQFE